MAPEQEDAGLDIIEHGMYGYPEQFIPAPEAVAAPLAAPAPGRAMARHQTGSERDLRR